MWMCEKSSYSTSTLASEVAQLTLLLILIGQIVSSIPPKIIVVPGTNIDDRVIGFFHLQ